MSDSIELLFIGGSADGRRLEVGGDRYVIEKLPTSPVISSFANSVEITINYESYRKERLRGNSKTFEVMLLEGLTGEDLIERLIKNYISVSW